MTVKTLNNVMVIEANFSMEELFKVYKHKPDVLSLKDDDGNMLFAVKPSEHRESFSDCGISFVSNSCLLYTSPSPRDKRQSRMPSSA